MSITLPIRGNLSAYSDKIWQNFWLLLTSSIFGVHTTYGVTKCKNKRCGVCNIIIEGKSYNFETQKTTFIIITNLSCN